MVWAQIISGVIFIGSLALIFTEKLNRTIVAMLGASIMLVVGMALGFYSEQQALDAIDLKTIGLLLGMMTLVALLEPTGFFEFLALWAGRISKGNLVRLLFLLGTITTVLSMFLDNVTTVVLVAPITILICEILGITATPFLISEALLSNIGGAATLVGDPPNVLIGSEAGLSFNDFLVNSFPIVVCCWVVSLVLIRFLFKNELSQTSVDAEALEQIQPAEALKDRSVLRRVLGVLGLAILLFFLQEILHVSSAVIATGAAAVGLTIVRPDLPDTLKRIDWSVLLFFAALFVMVGGLEASGLLGGISSALGHLRGFPIVLFGVILIWITAILSAVVDNVPITIAMIPVIQGLSETGLDVSPLWWALVFGAGFGGNATIIGSTANIVVTSVSEKTHSPITSAMWSKKGLPVMVVSCLIASVLYAIMFS